MKPHPVVVLRRRAGADGWNARFSAIGRAYRYRILNRRARPALLAGRVWHVHAPLDAEAMHAAAQSRCLAGTISPRSAPPPARRKARCARSIGWRARDGEIIEIVAEARSFLHHQVRNMVGTLKLVGDGRWPVERVAAALTARDRSRRRPNSAGGWTVPDRSSIRSRSIFRDDLITGLVTCFERHNI